MEELDIVISFDTTGSMSSILYLVRQEIARLTEVIFMNSRARGISVQLAIMAQGDYGGRIAIQESTACGADYTVLCSPFSLEPEVPINFIKSVRESAHQARENGEAYEQVLRTARALAWRPGAKKALVLVGDDMPHTVGCGENVDHVDWRSEMKELVNNGVKIYALHCLTMWGETTTPFYRELGASGAYIPMAQFNAFVELLLASFYSATAESALLEQHEQEVIAAGRYSRSVELAFNNLLQRPDMARAALPTDSGTGGAGGSGGVSRIPVTNGRFQRLNVDAEQTIKAFVEATGARYKAGGGYYQLTKSEDISPKKNVVMEHIASGEMFEEARSLLGLSATQHRASLRSVPAGYRAFVQSTSHTRKLMKDTSFLLEVVA